MYRLTLLFLFSVFLQLSSVCSADDLGLEALASKVEVHKLDNGLRVLFYSRGVAPVFAGVITARVGGVDEIIGETGIAHMLEHMLFKGTQSLGTSNYSKEKKLLERLEVLVDKHDGAVPATGEDLDEWNEVQKELAKLWDDEVISREFKKQGETGLNASTSQELTNYYVQLPSAAFEYWCWLESQRIFNPVFRQFYKERDVVLEERRMRFDDSPGGKVYEALISSAFSAHPYRFPTIGYPFDLQRLRPSQADEFHKRYYIPANMVLSIVGDVDPERDLPIVEKYFGKLESRPIPKQVIAVEPEQNGERRTIVKHNSSPTMRIGYKKPVYPDEEDAKISVMAEILAGSIVSPLYKQLVEKQKIATSVSSYEAPGYLFPNLLIFDLTPQAPTTNSKLLSAFDRLVSKLKSSAVTDDQLKIAKKAITVSLVNRFSSNSALAQEIAASELLYGSFRALTDWHSQVQKVTAKDVKEMMDKYLVRDRRTIAFLERE